MKNLFLLLCLCFVFNLQSQQYNYLEGETTLPIRIDTTQINNLWQIGRPQKSIFNQALSAPNALMTDTINDIAGQNFSSFQFTIDEEYTLWSYPYVILMLWHKMEVDSLHAGAWIEASYDGGATWNNIYEDSIYSVFVLDYSPRDTLFNGEIGFASNHSEWKMSTICWGIIGNKAPYPDSILMRFNFASDSLALPQEGWMIDNIEAYPEIIHTVEELREMANQEALLVYPNPAKEYVNVFYRIDEKAETRINFFSLNGKLIYQKEYGEKSRGIYNEAIDLTNIPNLPNLFIVNIDLGNRQYSQKVILAK